VNEILNIYKISGTANIWHVYSPVNNQGVKVKEC